MWWGFQHTVAFLTNALTPLRQAYHCWVLVRAAKIAAMHPFGERSEFDLVWRHFPAPPIAWHVRNHMGGVHL